MRNTRDKKNKDFEERGFGREKGQNLQNCRENTVLGVNKATQTETSKNKTQITKQKQVLLEQPLQQQQLLEKKQQSSTSTITTTSNKQQINNISKT